MKMFTQLAVLSLIVVGVLSYTGVDVSVAVSSSDYQCLVGQGYTFAVARCLRSNGKVDTNCAANVRAAQSGGMSSVDVYAFPCMKCGNAQAQINATLAALNGVSYGIFWLDIEGPQYWGSVSANQAFFQDMVSALQQQDVKIGIYTSSSQWGPIMGSSTAGSSFPLWYAHYNGQESFSDFTPFGGWNTPAIKQYKETQSVCGISADLNWYPGGSTSATSASSNSGHTNSNTNSNSGHSNSNSGPSSNSGHSASNSGPSSATSGPSSNTASSGPNTASSSGQNTASSGYTSSNSGGEEFKLSDQAIYNQVGGGKLTKERKVNTLSKGEFSANHVKLTEEKNIKKFN